MTDPASQTAAAGTVVTFAAAATGTTRTRAQSQVSTDGGATFAHVPGAIGGEAPGAGPGDGRRQAVPGGVHQRGRFDGVHGGEQGPKVARTGNLYRAVLTNAFYQLASPAAVLTVSSSGRPGSFGDQRKKAAPSRRIPHLWSAAARKTARAGPCVGRDGAGRCAVAGESVTGPAGTLSDRAAPDADRPGCINPGPAWKPRPGRILGAIYR